MRPWRASLLHSKQSRSMRPSSARAPRRGLRCSSTSRCFTIGSACTQPWDTEPRPRLAPAWRRSPCARQPDILIAPLHTKGGGPLGKDIRKWFTRDFFDYHVRRFKKRPIYWMFSSPKGSFNALIYMHRYRPDTVSVVLNDYLREYISKLQTERTRLEKLADD